MLEFSPFPEVDSRPESDKARARLGEPYVIDVETPDDMQVEDLGFGHKAVPGGDGRHISALEVVIRGARGAEGYRIIKVESGRE